MSCKGKLLWPLYGGGGERENDKADSGTAVPCNFFSIPMSFCSVNSWSRLRLFMFIENWKLRSLTFLKSILSLIFQRFKQKDFDLKGHCFTLSDGGDKKD